MSNYATLAAIGHVDHGKTALVRALTGIDTDRLKEEKERGISIVLGFAQLELPSGTLGIIDAPGHERFIRAMISGATGAASALLVVDVNEGVKPQTLEHLQIAQLLGLTRGIIAVSKADAAMPGRREAVRAELADLARDTFIERAPIVFTSAVTREGIDDLIAALDNLVASSAPPEDEGLAYLPVDRVFTMTGFGTVVTGTLRRGGLAVGDTVALVPHGGEARVRELHSHGEHVERCPPGRRVAVNLRGVDKQSLSRGDVLASPGSLRVGRLIDASVTLLDTAPLLKHRQEVRLLFGTAEVMAKTHLLDRDELLSGDSCVLQFRATEDAALPFREPFILRTASPATTIGGGRLLGAAHALARRNDAESLARMQSLATFDPGEILSTALGNAGFGGASSAQLARDYRLSGETVAKFAGSTGATDLGEGWLLDRASRESLAAQIAAAVSDHHKAQPTLAGISAELLLAALPEDARTRTAQALVRELVAVGTLRVDRGLVSLATFDRANALGPKDRELAEIIERAFRYGGFEPPGLDEIVGLDKDRKRIYRYLLDEGILHAAEVTTRNKHINKAIAFHRATLDDACARLRKRFCDGATFTAAEAKEVIETSRKFLIPLLECLDATGFTKRQGDVRRLVTP